MLLVICVVFEGLIGVGDVCRVKLFLSLNVSFLFGILGDVIVYSSLRWQGDGCFIFFGTYNYMNQGLGELVFGLEYFGIQCR